jgi:hypothetical protein
MRFKGSEPILADPVPPSGLIRMGISQGKPWAKLFCPLRATEWKPMLLYAFASPVAARGNSSQDGSESPHNSPENQCCIGFQPVFCHTVKDGPGAPSGLIRMGNFPG